MVDSGFLVLEVEHLQLRVLSMTFAKQFKHLKLVFAVMATFTV